METLDETLRLGLIGGNITASRSPALHVTCGLIAGRNVTYDLIVPAERGLSFGALLDQCAGLGFHGVNVTYPHKEQAAAMAVAGTATVAAMGAANTVRFTADGARAYNTDHSGFAAAYRHLFGETAPGRVLMLGAGGVGRAIAFALADLGASELVLHDRDAARCAALAGALAGYSTMPVRVAAQADLTGLAGADGVVNCTPVGMVGNPGTPLPDLAGGRPAWAFDAVYTPGDTPFRQQMEQLGAIFLDGWELYFHQGLHAFEIFSGQKLTDCGRIRAALRGGAG